MESQLTNIQSFLSQRQLDNLPSQPEPNPKREDTLIKEDQAPEKIEVPTDGNPVPKNEGDIDIS